MNAIVSRRRFGAAAILSGAFAAGLPHPTPSVAAPGNGASVFKDAYCFDYDGSTICYTNMAVVKETTTPSGNNVFMGNGSSSYSQTDPSGATYEDTLKYHTQGVTMDEVLKEYGQFFTSTLTVGWGTCTTRYAFHAVNGDIQFDRMTTCL
jgi:hypothetical protein